MRYLSLIILMVVLVGCVEPDPMRAAIAQERTIQATNSQAAQQSQIERAQQADTDARNAQELLQALQAQQAIVAAQAAQAQAQSQTAIVVSNNQALVLVADKIAEASRTDYTPLYAGLAALVVIVVVWLIVNGRRGSSVVAPKLLFHSAHAEAWLLVDGTIHLRRLSDGQARVYLPSDAMYAKLLTGGKGVH
jgi:hypothetical protein